MINNRSLVMIAILAVAAWIASACFFVVSETQRAVELRFGKVVNQDIAPGLHVKWPVINTVRLFDNRLQTMENNGSYYEMADGSSVQVDSFVKWRIEDPSILYNATNGNLARAESLMGTLVNDRLRDIFSEKTPRQIIHGDSQQEITSSIDDINTKLAKSVGIQVLAIRIKQVNVPDDMTKVIYQRMNDARHASAQQYLAQAKEEAQSIRSQAELKRQVTIANAQQTADELRANGDANAAAIYTKAYQQDPEFYRFYASLEAYRKSFSGNKSLLVLSPDSEFFHYMNNSGSQGVTSKAPNTQ